MSLVCMMIIVVGVIHAAHGHDYGGVVVRITVVVVGMFLILVSMLMIVEGLLIYCGGCDPVLVIRLMLMVRVRIIVVGVF
jgi:hypothetical protein